MKGNPADSATTIRIMGPMVIEVDAIEVRLAPAVRRLLSILLLDAAADLPTDTIIDRMWGDDAPPTARTSLHVHISTLRKQLPGVVVTTGTGYRLEEGRSGEGTFTRFVGLPNVDALFAGQ